MTNLLMVDGRIAKPPLDDSETHRIWVAVRHWCVPTRTLLYTIIMLGHAYSIRRACTVWDVLRSTPLPAMPSMTMPPTLYLEIT